MTTKYIHFHNATEFPIMVDSWVDGSNTLECIKILSGEKLVIHSSVGEWHVNSMFPEEDDRKLWSSRGLKNYINLGKFRSDPCASGEYSWMDWDHIFDCVYSEIEGDDVRGLITFVFKGLP
jgi:hypothetical protein